MSILILVNGVDSEAKEAQLIKLISSFEEISKKHNLTMKETTSKNFHPYLCPVLCFIPKENNAISLLISDAITILGESRLNTHSNFLKYYSS